MTEIQRKLSHLIEKRKYINHNSSDLEGVLKTLQKYNSFINLSVVKYKMSYDNIVLKRFNDGYLTDLDRQIDIPYVYTEKEQVIFERDYLILLAHNCFDFIFKESNIELTYSVENIIKQVNKINDIRRLFTDLCEIVKIDYLENFLNLVKRYD